MWIDTSNLKTLSSNRGMSTKGMLQLPDAFAANISVLAGIQTVEGLAQDLIHRKEKSPDKVKKAQLSLMREHWNNPANFHLGSEHDGNGLDAPSVGSLGHPLKCADACKYVHKARGCKDGASCTRCHLCQWRRIDPKTAAEKKIKKGESRLWASDTSFELGEVPIHIS